MSQANSWRKITTLQELTTDLPQIITDTGQVGKTSERYKPIQTLKAVEMFMDHDWHPMSYHVKNKNNPHGFHGVVLRQGGKKAETGAEIPEIVLSNSADGSAPFDLDLAMFRVWCGNQWVVKTKSLFNMRQKHIGFDLETFFGQFSTVVDKMTEFTKQIDLMKNTPLEYDQRLEFAKKCMGYRLEGTSFKVEEFDDRFWVDFCWPKRPEDSYEKYPDVFTAANVFQEKIILGEFDYPSGKRKGRAVTGLESDFDLNSKIFYTGLDYLPTEERLFADAYTDSLIA